MSYGFLLSLTAMSISVGRLSWIAHKHHDQLQPRTLSELAADQEKLLHYFRVTLLICGTLFAWALYDYIIPYLQHPLGVSIAWTVTLIGNYLVAILPARTVTRRVHELCAQIMAASMIAMAYLFSYSLTGWHQAAEVALTLAMCGLAVATVLDKRRFIFYELSFLYLSHTSIVIAAIFIEQAGGHWI